MFLTTPLLTASLPPRPTFTFRADARARETGDNAAATEAAAMTTLLPEDPCADEPFFLPTMVGPPLTRALPLTSVWPRTSPRRRVACAPRAGFAEILSAAALPVEILSAAALVAAETAAEKAATPADEAATAEVVTSEDSRGRATANTSTEQAAQVVSLEVVSPDIAAENSEARESPTILERSASMDDFSSVTIWRQNR